MNYEDCQARFQVLLRQLIERDGDINALLEDRKEDLKALGVGIGDAVSAYKKLTTDQIASVIATALNAAYVMGIDDQKGVGDLSAWEDAL